MKKKALLIMAATWDYMFAVGNVLLGLKRHSPLMFDDIIIYTDKKTSKKDKKCIQKIFNNIEFKIFDFQLDNEADRQRLNRYYSNMPYARFEMLSYLNRYEKVVWFDSDFLILDDVSGLLDYARTGISMSVDLEPYPEGHNISRFFIKEPQGYDMNAIAYASGLIIFSDLLENPKKLREYLYQKMNEYSSYVLYAEQGILQMMIEDFKLKVDEFDKLTYHCFPCEDKSRARLIHLLGPNKPWICFMGDAYEQWYENHCKWIALGGSEAFSFTPLIKSDNTNEAINLGFSRYFCGERRYQNILMFKELRDRIETQYGAVQRVKFRLCYRIGEKVVNARSFLERITLPFAILLSIFAYKKERKIFDLLQNIKPNFFLAELQMYADYEEAIKITESTPYKIGQILLKNPLKIFRIKTLQKNLSRQNDE